MTVVQKLLSQLNYCQEIVKPVNLFHALNIQTPTEENRYIFCPAMIQAPRVNLSWKSPEHKSFSKGYFITAVRSFPCTFVNAVLLDLSSTIVFPFLDAPRKGPRKSCYCELWKDGIQWMLRTGVEVLVEGVEEGRGVAVMVRGSELGCDRTLSGIMSRVLKVKANLCHSLETEIHYIHPDDFKGEAIPGVRELHLFNMAEIQQALQQTGVPVEAENLLLPYSKMSGLKFWSKQT